MPKPFPFALNIGTDICHVPRILSILRGQIGREGDAGAKRFVRRILREDERAEYAQRINLPLERWSKALKVKASLDLRRRELVDGRGMVGAMGGWGRGLGVDAALEAMVRDGREVKSDETTSSEQASTVVDDAVTDAPPGWWDEMLRELGKANPDFSKKRTRSYLEYQMEQIRDEKGLRALRFPYEDILQGVEDGFGIKKSLFEAMRLQALEMEAAEKRKAVEAEEEKAMSAAREERLDNVNSIVEATEENSRELAAAVTNLQSVARFLAGRFAAKEAAMKAHAYRRLTYHDIAIRKVPDNEHGSRAPVAFIFPENEAWDEAQEVRINISHDGDYATATCLAAEPIENIHTDLKEGLKISTGIH